MARLPLIHIPGGLYSVVSKCNNNEFLFDAPEKFELYLEHLLECKAKLGFTLYDICCMSNHVHELYRLTSDVTIADILKRVKGIFAQKFNKRFGRTGHFWKNKPFYRIVENEQYAYNTVHYYHINPLKAGMVTSPGDWPYSGYRFHFEGARDGILGKLLDPIPGFTPDLINQNQLKAIEKIARSKRRFIGSHKFQLGMRQKFGRSTRCMEKGCPPQGSDA